MPKPTEEAINALQNETNAIPEPPEDENGNPIAPPEGFRPPFPGGRPPEPTGDESGGQA